MIPYNLYAPSAIGAALCTLSFPQAVQLAQNGSGRLDADSFGNFGFVPANGLPLRLTSAGTFRATTLGNLGSKFTVLDHSGASTFTAGVLAGQPVLPWRAVAIVPGTSFTLPAWIQGRPAGVIVSSAVSPPLVANLAAPKAHLISLIEAKLSTVADANTDMAKAAAHDATIVVQGAKLGGNPRVMFSDDGILTLQWQRGDYGLALIFAGDGVTSIAFRRPGQLYVENGIEVPILDDLPKECHEALARILA